MLFKDITYVDESMDVVERGFVGVRDKRIAYVGQVAPEEDFGETYEGRGKLLLPAFYNAHSHLPMCIMRGYGEGLSLMDWLTTRIFPFEGKLTNEDMYWSTKMGVLEMLRYGIAGTTEMYLSYLPAAAAFKEMGVKANYSRSVTGDGSVAFKDMSDYTDALRCRDEFDAESDGRLVAEFSLHAEYTSCQSLACQVAEAAKEHGMGVHVHVSETRGEVEECRQRHGGMSPVRYLAECGMFDVPAMAAHCVWVNEDDIAILRDKHVTVGTCPKSNAKLGSGIAPLTRLLDAGVNVALGTDSVTSNNNLNMIEEMRFANLLQKANALDPKALSLQQTLYMATRAGALAQRRDDCGLIKEGFRADITVLDMDTPCLQPSYNRLTDLVFSVSGSDVVLTMVDGKVLYCDGSYPAADAERIVYEVEQRRQRILGELK